MHSSLVDVSETINSAFFQRVDHCILTSATLKIQDSFDYFLKRLGIDQGSNIVKKEFSEDNQKIDVKGILKKLK